MNCYIFLLLSHFCKKGLGGTSVMSYACVDVIVLNTIALRKAKIVHNFGLSECKS